jgi:cell division control protein 6
MTILIANEIENTFSVNKGIFKDEFVFEENYEPNKIFHREYEIQEVISFFKSVSEGSTDNIDLCGPTGTGKTLIIKEIIKEFQKRFQDIKIVYINCAEDNTKTKVLNKFSRKLIDNKKVTGGFINTIETVLQTLRGSIIILDEVDKVLLNDGNDLLYILSNTSKISIVNISNIPQWRKFITDNRIDSRMPPNQTLFHAYRKEELFDILKNRAEKGLKENTYTDEILNEIAKTIAMTSGNAREAIKMLRRAAKHSEGLEKIEIAKSSLIYSEHKREDDSVIEYISGLPLVKRICLVALFDFWKKSNKYPTAEQTTERYNMLIKDTHEFNQLSLHTVRNYLSELFTYGLVEKIGGKGLGQKMGKEPLRYKLSIDLDIFEREIYNKSMKK